LSAIFVTLFHIYTAHCLCVCGTYAASSQRLWHLQCHFRPHCSNS